MGKGRQEVGAMATGRTGVVRLQTLSSSSRNYNVLQERKQKHVRTTLPKVGKGTKPRRQ